MRKGRHYEEHGITRVGKWIREVGNTGKNLAPELLEIAGSVPGLGVLKTVSELIEKEPNLTEVDKETAKVLIEKDIEELRNQGEQIRGHYDVEVKQITSEDNWTRRARPTRQYFWLLLLLHSYVIWPHLNDGNALALPFEVIVMIGSDFGAYTLMRTYEKTTGSNPVKNLVDKVRRRR